MLAKHRDPEGLDNRLGLLATLGQRIIGSTISLLLPCPPRNVIKCHSDGAAL